eukprot:5442873-Pyramimonas_sp.AAC.1
MLDRQHDLPAQPVQNGRLVRGATRGLRLGSARCERGGGGRCRKKGGWHEEDEACLLYTSPSPRDRSLS